MTDVVIVGEFQNVLWHVTQILQFVFVQNSNNWMADLTQAWNVDFTIGFLANSPQEQKMLYCVAYIWQIPFTLYAAIFWKTSVACHTEMRNHHVAMNRFLSQEDTAIGHYVSINLKKM